MTPARARGASLAAFRMRAFARPSAGAGIACARATIAVAVVVACVEAPPNPGARALQAHLAASVARGMPTGAVSLGWLGASVGSFVASFGAGAGALAAAACILIALGLVERRAAAAVAQRIAVLAVPLAALCAIDALRPAAGALAMAFTALAMMLLAVPSRRDAIAYTIATVAWCNLEPAGLLAPLFAVAVAAGASLDAPRLRDAACEATLRTRWFVAVAASLATCCTPAGIGFQAAAWDALRLGDAARGIAAVVPSVTAPHAYHVGLFAVLTLALAVGVRGRGLREAVPAAAAFVLALANGAFVPLFGIVAAPAIVAALRDVRLPPFAAPSAAIVAVCAVAFAARADASASATARQPYALAARAVRDDGARGTLFCANVDWCDVATAGGERVVMDGRIAPYDDAARAMQRAIAGAGRGFDRALATSGATAVLAASDSPLATLLALTPGWRVADRDDRATLFERHR